MGAAAAAGVGRLSELRPRLRALDPGLLLRAYSVGLFPMAESRDADGVFWVEPRRRGVLPLDGFHLPASLAKTLRRERFTLTTDHAFEAVIAGCGEPAPDRPDTWINPTIVAACRELFARGHAHSVECWADGALAGGLYGVSLGGAFFGESMFTRVTDASKVALAHLITRLRAGGYRLLDTQFLTDHLARFGAIEVPREDYKRRLAAAVAVDGDWTALDRLAGGAGSVSGGRIAQLLTQTS